MWPDLIIIYDCSGRNMNKLVHTKKQLTSSGPPTNFILLGRSDRCHDRPKRKEICAGHLDFLVQSPRKLVANCVPLGSTVYCLFAELLVNGGRDL